MDNQTSYIDASTAAAAETDLFQLDMQDFGPSYSYENAAALCACVSCSCMRCFCGCGCIDYIPAAEALLGDA